MAAEDKIVSPKEKTGLIDWLIHHSKKIIIGVVVFALVTSGTFVGVALYKKSSVDPNVVAEVGGEKIYLTEYKERLFAAGGGYGSPTNPFISEATKPIKESVLKELVDLKIVNKELAKISINITDEELAKQAEIVFKDYKDRDASVQKAYKNYVRLSVGKRKLEEKVVNWKEGYILYCYFDRADRNDLKDKTEAEKNTKRTEDQAYAKEYCTQAKSRLETGQSTYEQELVRLKADPRIGEAAWKPYNMSFGDKLTREDNNKGAETVISVQESNPTPSVSGGSVVTSENDFVGAYDVSVIMSLSNDKDKYYLLTLKEKVTTKNQDGAFAVVYVKNGNKGETNNFDKWLKDKNQEYQVKTYIERIKI